MKTQQQIKCLLFSQCHSDFCLHHFRHCFQIVSDSLKRETITALLFLFFILLLISQFQFATWVWCYRLHGFIMWKSWFISADTRWSKWKCLMLLCSPWYTGGCHWLTMTFSLMVMTFCFSQCLCSRGVWQKERRRLTAGNTRKYYITSFSTPLIFRFCIQTDSVSL